MLEAPLSNLSPSLYVAVVVPSSIVIGVVVAFLFGRFVKQLTRTTKTVLDDIVVDNLRIPIPVSLTMYGLWLSLHKFKPSLTVEFAGEAAILSLLLVVWSFSTARGASQFLKVLSKHQGRLSLVNGRTLPLLDIVAKVVVYGGLVYFLFLAWGIDVTGWLASAGIVGVAVGFAAQETLSNLIAGVFILADGPYQLGDYLVLENGHRGVVTNIGFRTTRLLTKDDVEIIVPNGMMANATITNESGGPSKKTRVNIPIGVAYGTDIDEVRAILQAIPADIAGIAHTPTPEVRFDAFGASSLDFTLRVWLVNPDLRSPVVDAVNTAIYKAFVTANIEIPFSKHDVYLYPMGAESSPSETAENDD